MQSMWSSNKAHRMQFNKYNSVARDNINMIQSYSYISMNKIHLLIAHIEMLSINTHLFELLSPKSITENRYIAMNKTDRLSFKTWGKLPIVWEEYVEYTPNHQRKNRKMSNVTSWTWDDWDLDRLCPKLSLGHRYIAQKNGTYDDGQSQVCDTHHI